MCKQIELCQNGTLRKTRHPFATRPVYCMAWCQISSFPFHMKSIVFLAVFPRFVKELVYTSFLQGDLSKECACVSGETLIYKAEIS